MRASVKGQTLVPAFGRLLPSSKGLANKWWARPLPAAAVITAPQVVIAYVGPKASVAGLASLL